MKSAIVLAAVAAIGFAVPTANAEDAVVGVGVVPGGPGVTVGQTPDRDRDHTTVIKRDEPSERTTVIKREDEPGEHTTVIKKEHDD